MAVKKKSKVKTKKKPAARKKAAAKRPHHAPVSHEATQHTPATGAGGNWQKSKYTNLREFWPFYLNEHSRKANRALHFVGSSLGLVILGVAVLSQKYILIVPALVSGYAFAWIGHFFIEKNRPATFRYPVKSFISDWRMWYCIFMDKIDSEMQRFGIRSK